MEVWENEYAPDKGVTTHPGVEQSRVWIVNVSAELMSSSCVMTPCEVGYELTSSMNKRISALEERMTVNRKVLRGVCTVQLGTHHAMHKVP